jgi:hypothetical protein
MLRSVSSYARKVHVYYYAMMVPVSSSICVYMSASHHAHVCVASCKPYVSKQQACVWVHVDYTHAAALIYIDTYTTACWGSQYVALFTGYMCVRAHIYSYERAVIHM